MDLLKSIILGIIQGLTEFLPVSSSGHLVIFQNILNFEKPDLTFEILLHFGSLMAVLIYFRKEILELLFSLGKWKNPDVTTKNNHKLIGYLMISTIITGTIGFLFQDFFEKIFQAVIFTPIMLYITGIIIFSSDKIKSKNLDASEMGIIRAILIGLGQSVSILPGISRSGSTIAVSLFTGMKREQAARYSFLLSIPVILGAIVLKLDEITSLPNEMIFNYSMGIVAAFISGFLVIKWLLNIVKNQKLKYFAYYCWSVSTIFLIWYLLHK